MIDLIFNHIDLSSTRAITGTLPDLDYVELEFLGITDIVPILDL